ncbi:hypothetical protein AVEN_253784-1 [Araneus ventricosus]|uniref:Uncharacterized protein n=1 Tax=Araneus ventricosus TaxID=182803 RepID=A0A4Y2J1K3_ARAVE|nr:hypothetical protein AVEN_253784-1 [Araneus ventricosus]
MTLRWKALVQCVMLQFENQKSIREQRNLQSRGRTSGLLARNLRVHFNRHHREGFPEGRQMEEEIQKEEEESTDF